MLRRTLLAFLLCTAALATVASAQPPALDLFYHHRVFQNREVHQAATMLQLQVPANGWATPAALRAAQIDAAVDWFVNNGYFSDPASVDFISGPNSNTLVFEGPGIHIVIVLPSGPFLPTQREQLLAATIIRTLPQVNNGY